MKTTVGGRLNVRDEHDLEALAEVADDCGFSLACLIAAAEGDGEPLLWANEEVKRG